MDKLYELDNYFKKLTMFKFVSVMVFLSVLIVLPLVPLSMIFQVDEVASLNSTMDLSFDWQVFIAAIVAPIIETFLFQTLVILGLRRLKFFRSRMYIVVIISALIFGIVHTYSLIYIMYAFLMGLILAYSYNVYIEKVDSSFIVVALIHSARNILALIAASITIN